MMRDCPGCLDNDRDQVLATGADTVVALTTEIHITGLEEVVEQLLCTEHVTELMHTTFPNRCRDCRRPRDAMTDVVIVVRPFDPFDSRRPAPLLAVDPDVDDAGQEWPR